MLFIAVRTFFITRYFALFLLAADELELVGEEVDELEDGLDDEVGDEDDEVLLEEDASAV